MTSATSEPDFYNLEDLPAASGSQGAQDAYDRIMARHVLATLRQSSGLTQVDVANNKGVSKAAIHQLENRPLARISIGSLVG